MYKFIQKVLIVLTLPFIYARYSFVFFIPLLFVNPESEGYPFYLPFVYLWGIYFLLFTLIGYCDFMVKYITFIQKILLVKFKIGKLWMHSETYNYSHNKHPTIEVNGKKYELQIAVMGGATYSYEYHLVRKSIFYTLFG